jgi:Glycosyl hydrolase family 59
MSVGWWGRTGGDPGRNATVRNIPVRSVTARAAGLVAGIVTAVALAGCGATIAAPSPSKAVPASLTRAQTTNQTASQTMVVNGSRPGPVFDGIGALSGGGGNSRLLIDYPAPERAQILDYMFKPHYGASLQMLKLEIGGGGFSSDGSEPSVEAVKGHLTCNVGYEFWLAHQALARNPKIKLYGLQWTAPSWARDPAGKIWSTADVNYLVDWLRCAQKSGLTISYIGGWNEHYRGTADERDWYVNLRKALDAAGFTRTEVVAADQTPQFSEGLGRPLGYFPLFAWRTVADDMAEDPAFAKAVSVLGIHDTCGLPTTGFRCVVAARAKVIAGRLGKPLWESELGATPDSGVNPDQAGPSGLARAINDAYNGAGVTGIIVWPLLDAIPPNLPYENRGLVQADQPWSGYYQVTPLSWVIAQTTQFTEPGWRHVNGANGLLPNDGNFDTYNTYEAPNRSAWSLVAETSAATAAERETIRVTGGLPARVVHVWATNLRGPGQFMNLGDIRPHDGTFSTVLQPGYVYTFTTTTGQSRAGRQPAAVPAASPAPLPYTATQDAAGMARLLSPVEGSFGYVHGTLTQTTVGQPVEWHYLGPGISPYAVVGDNTWSDYTVSARVVLPRSGTGSAPPGAGLIARFQGIAGGLVSQFRGYELKVDSSGAWQLTVNGSASATLASGKVAARHTYNLSLTTQGTTISARVDGVHVATVTNRAYQNGPAGLASLGYYPVQYPRFSVG